jgi:hypothetical protein
MIVMTEDEVRTFIKKNEWATGIKVGSDGRSLYYDNPESNCIELRFPDKPMQVPYFTRVASSLSLDHLDREELFYGAVLWLTLWEIGSPQLEKTGWRTIEKMRLGFGETRPIPMAPGHSFRSDEFVDLNAFLIPCFIFGWDAWLIPSGNDYFVHISHDEFWVVVTKTAKIHEVLLQQLSNLSPQVPHERCKARFCHI